MEEKDRGCCATSSLSRIPTGTFWCDSSSSEAWTWRKLIKQLLAKNYVMTPLVYIMYNRKKNHQYLQSMLWRTSWSSSKKGDQVLQESLLWQVLATHFMSVRSEVAETTLHQWKMKITFPSIIAFFCITGKVHPKWTFAVNLLTLRPFKM